MGLTPWTEGEEVILEWVNYGRVDRVKVQFFWQLILPIATTLTVCLKDKKSLNEK